MFEKILRGCHHDFGKLHVRKNRKIRHGRFQGLQLFVNPSSGSAVVVV